MRAPLKRDRLLSPSLLLPSRNALSAILYTEHRLIVCRYFPNHTKRKQKYTKRIKLRSRPVNRIYLLTRKLIHATRRRCRQRCDLPGESIRRSFFPCLSHAFSLFLPARFDSQSLENKKLKAHAANKGERWSTMRRTGPTPFPWMSSGD